MCINTRIQEKLNKKAALDAEIAKLEELAAKTVPVKELLEQLLADYFENAPEELPLIWGDILSAGQKYNLALAHPATVLLPFEAEEEIERLQDEIEEAKTVNQQLNEKSQELQKQLIAYEVTVMVDNAFESAGITPKAEVWDKESIAPGLEELSQEAEAQSEPEHESDEAYDTVESILNSTGFDHPEQFFTFWDAKEKYENYRGWDVYFSVPNGGIVAIGLHDITQSEAQAWDASTEVMQELDSTFPEFLDDFDKIVAWTRQLIDRVENLEAPGQLRLPLEILATPTDDEDEKTELQKLLDEKSEFVFEELEAKVKATSEFSVTTRGEEPETIEKALFSVSDLKGGSELQHFYYDPEEFTEFHYSHSNKITHIERIAKQCAQQWSSEVKLLRRGNLILEPQIELFQGSLNLESVDMVVTMTPSMHTKAGVTQLAGATFVFANSSGEKLFESSRAREEIKERQPLFMALKLAHEWLEREAGKKHPPSGTAHTEPEKPDDFTELVKLSNAVGYLKRRDNGELLSAYAAFSNVTETGEKTATKAKSRTRKWAEWLTANFHWVCSEPRVCKRMVSENPKQEFAYELKITGKFSIGQLTKLAEEDFSLLPGETVVARDLPPVAESSPPETFRVKVNSYELASGTEAEMRSRFEEELKILGGSQMSVTLLSGSEIVESYRVAEFNFAPVEDFDADNPEYKVTHFFVDPFTVWQKLAVPDNAKSWRNSIYPYEHFTKREAAAVDAVRRLLKAQSATE